MALQEEYFCDDVEPPPHALGWSEAELRSFFESGGEAAAGHAEGISAAKTKEQGSSGQGSSGQGSSGRAPPDEGAALMIDALNKELVETKLKV